MKEFLARHMPPDYSAHGHEIDHLITDIHLVMLVLFLFWGAFFVYVLVRFRSGRQPEAQYSGMRSRWALYFVAVVAVVELFHLFAYSIPAWQRWSAPPSRAGNPLELRIVAEQFAWNVQYPGADGIFGRRDVKLVGPDNPLGLDPSDPAAKDDVATINELHLQVGRPAIIHVMSKDVIHSFKLPVMRVEQDAIPGMDIPIHFTPIRVNKGEDWEIACAQLCGLGHYRMRGMLMVDSQKDFDQFLKDNASEYAAAPSPEATRQAAADPAPQPVTVHRTVQAAAAHSPGHPTT